eukprot:5122148-Pyramimonas_sp.AAC.1
MGQHSSTVLPDLAETALLAWKASTPLSERGAKVLDAPVGSRGETCRERAKFSQYLHRLSIFQMAWPLLYYCTVPRFNHFRNLPPDTMQVLANGAETLWNRILDLA